MKMVTSSRSQYEVKSLQGRSVRLDIYATDEKGQLYDVEVQQVESGANPKRARYYSSLVDANCMQPGEDWEALKTSYVIFITKTDVLERGKPIYHIERTVRETQEPFGDAQHILYVNGAYRGDDPIGRLMRDFSCTRAEDMETSPISKRVHQLKNSEGGQNEMCKIMEDLCKEALQEGREEEKLDTLCNLVWEGHIAASTAAEKCGLSGDAFRAAMQERYPDWHE